MKSDLDSFDQQGRIFWGAEYYPYGLDRSGEFTHQQVELLKAHGFAYEALASGGRSASTPEETAFVEVFRSGRPAQTSHEKLWLRFLERSNRRNEIVSLGGGAANANDAPAIDTDDLTDLT